MKIRKRTGYLSAFLLATFAAVIVLTSCGGETGDGYVKENIETTAVSETAETLPDLDFGELHMP